ncbi:MAG: glycerol-3-phosphate dehydrogenase/oxidase, partial [Thermoanaerobaculia bacterium]
RLTWESVRERERLVNEAPGLVERLGFLLANYEGDRPGPLTYGLGLAVYDLLAGKLDHEHFSPNAFRMLAPHLAAARLSGGFRYGDAGTDDARLVLRLLHEAVRDGGTVLNYAGGDELLRVNGAVVGIRVRDGVADRTAEAHASLVVNATGVWVDQLRGQLGAAPRMRPLRGSHLVFPSWRLPVGQAVSILHPSDRRPLFVLPWEGATVVGTTDVDHREDLDLEPAMSAPEAAYLMAALTMRLPSLDLTLGDAVASFSGVRPVIGTGKSNPSQESRDHVIWEESGLLTVTGGKLTTFRLIARDTLRAGRRHLPAATRARGKELFDPVNGAVGNRRLSGRYGTDAVEIAQAAADAGLEPIAQTPYLWAELRFAARSEWVVHLDDLLLRRVRLGLLVADGGRALLPRIRAVIQPELGWSDARWEQEARTYDSLWNRCYGVPGVSSDSVSSVEPGAEPGRAAGRPA